MIGIIDFYCFVVQELEDIWVFEGLVYLDFLLKLLDVGGAKAPGGVDVKVDHFTCRKPSCLPVHSSVHPEIIRTGAPRRRGGLTWRTLHRLFPC